MTRDVRLNDGERESLIEALRHALSDGRISLEEFEERAGIVYAARLLSDADPAFAELPPVPTEASRRSIRRRRHGESDAPKPHWHATEEVFRDPSTGRVMRVWVDPSDGSRHYVAG